MIEPTWQNGDVSLYLGDCLEILPQLEAGSVDLIFADPPFNVGKDYGPLVNDNMPRRQYLAWCNAWLYSLWQLLCPGGSIYIMNLQENAAHHLVFLEGLGGDFQNTIAWRDTQWVTPKIRYSKQHQDIVFFTKPGEEHTFNCFADFAPHDRHWGGKEKYKHPDGARLTDIWQDISRVKGNFNEAIKGENGKAHICQMPIKLSDRIVLISSNPGDIVLDPFCGSGTTAETCVLKDRKFIGIDLVPEYIDISIKRISQAQLQLGPML